MADKSSAWRPGPTVCRCCLAEGCYKDISTEYFWMGKREVYADMLADTLSLSIGYSKTGGPNSNSRLICEPCISRLRDATDFKRQVQECEKTFMQYLDPGSSSVMSLMDSDDIQMETIEKDVKIEQVKVEKKYSDDEFDSRDFGDDDDDDDDMDQPLTTFASKEPKKETINLLDLLESPKKKTTKPKLVAKKKIIIKKDVKVKPTTSKAVPKSDDKKRKDGMDCTARRNAQVLLKCTTAYPFRVNDKSVLCVYCQELYDDPIAFRLHMNTEHDHPSLSKAVFHNLPKPEFIKADITDLRCNKCSQPFKTLEGIAEHLKTIHNENIELASKLGIMPYILQKDVFACAVCGKNEPSLFHLNRHTITHFLSYVCHVCGRSYVATTGLLRHVRMKHQDYQVSCKRCRQVFPTMEAKDKHRRRVKSCMPYCCPKCRERFIDYNARRKHLETAHGLGKKSNRCADCNIEFINEKLYYDHYKMHHTQDCEICKYCGLKFTSKYRYKRHMNKHVV